MTIECYKISSITHNYNEKYYYDNITGYTVPLSEIYPKYKPSNNITNKKMEAEWRLSLHL